MKLSSVEAGCAVVDVLVLCVGAERVRSFPSKALGAAVWVISWTGAVVLYGAVVCCGAVISFRLRWWHCEEGGGGSSIRLSRFLLLFNNFFGKFLIIDFRYRISSFLWNLYWEGIPWCGLILPPLWHGLLLTEGFQSPSLLYARFSLRSPIKRDNILLLTTFLCKNL